MTVIFENEIFVYNVVAFLSIVVPAIITAFVPYVPLIGSTFGLIIFLTLWFMPGCNYGCIHMFRGGWMPFIISYPLAMYFILDEEKS